MERSAAISLTTSPLNRASASPRSSTIASLRQAGLPTSSVTTRIARRETRRMLLLNPDDGVVFAIELQHFPDDMQVACIVGLSKP